MKWNKFRLKTTTEAEDIVSSMLMDLGVQGIEIEDKIPMTQAEKEQMFVDILPGFHFRLTQPSTLPLHPVNPDNACPLRITAAAGT